MTVRQTYMTYRQLYRIPVALAGTQVVLRIGAVGAVSMPDPLGSLVQRLLQPEQDAGPVYADPAAARWVFLTDGIPECEPHDRARLADAGVRIAEWGDQMALPLLSEGRKIAADERHWLWPPGYELPRPAPFLAGVLDAIGARRAHGHDLVNWTVA